MVYITTNLLYSTFSIQARNQNLFDPSPVAYSLKADACSTSRLLYAKEVPYTKRNSAISDGEVFPSV
jgi:hypothetical protein